VSQPPRAQLGCGSGAVASPCRTKPCHPTFFTRALVWRARKHASSWGSHERPIRYALVAEVATLHRNVTGRDAFSPSCEPNGKRRTTRQVYDLFTLTSSYTRSVTVVAIVIGFCVFWGVMSSPRAAAAAFVTSGSFHGQYGHLQPVPLSAGRVALVASNCYGSSPNAFEIFDPSTSNNSLRYFDTGFSYDDPSALVPLLDGRVLIAGAQNWCSGGSCGALGQQYRRSAVFDPAADTMTVVDNTKVSHTRTAGATVLADGRVLLVGGDGGAVAEVFDPASGTWAYTGSMSGARANFVTVRLGNGKVLVAGGRRSSSVLESAELFDPVTGTFSPTGSMTVAREKAVAAVLPDGKVLITGGGSATAEIYDPLTGVFTAVGSASVDHRNGFAVVLQDGSVLVAGGGGDAFEAPALAVAELYSPTAQDFSATLPLRIARKNPSAILLSNGTVLVAGSAMCESTVEIFNPSMIRSPPSGPRDAAVDDLESGRATVGWSSSLSAGDDPIESYVVRSQPDGRICTTNGDSRTCTVTGLTNGDNYTFTVEAVSYAGVSPVVTTELITAGGRPSAPTLVGTPAQVPGGGVSVAFSPGNDNGLSITSHAAVCDPVGGGQTRVEVGSQSPLTVRDLVPETRYRCHVTSTNAAGESAASGDSMEFVSGYLVSVVAVTGAGTVSDSTGVLACSVACVGQLPPGFVVSLEARADVGWAFAGWSGDCIGSAPSCSLLLDRARQVNASFVPIAASELPLRSAAESGSSASSSSAPRTPSGVRWGVAQKKGVVSASFQKAAATSYRISASRSGRVVTGSCRIGGSAVTCRVRVGTAGRWKITITPRLNGVAGRPVDRYVSVARITRAAHASLRMKCFGVWVPAELVSGRGPAGEWAERYDVRECIPLPPGSGFGASSDASVGSFSDGAPSQRNAEQFSPPVMPANAADS
jgi:hypothetical protein